MLQTRDLIRIDSEPRREEGDSLCAGRPGFGMNTSYFTDTVCSRSWPAVSYKHGSADICDSLTNTCAANQAAKTLCNRAKDAANAAPPLTGEQDDAFNAIW